MTTIKSIDPITASEWLDNKEAILIDVRELAEYNEVHIDGAHLIPVNTVSINKLPDNIRNKKSLFIACWGNGVVSLVKNYYQKIQALISTI